MAKVVRGHVTDLCGPFAVGSASDAPAPGGVIAMSQRLGQRATAGARRVRLSRRKPAQMSRLPKGRTPRQPSQEPTLATARFGSTPARCE